MRDISELLPKGISWSVIHPAGQPDPILTLTDAAKDRHVDIAVTWDEALPLSDLKRRVITPALAALVPA